MTTPDPTVDAFQTLHDLIERYGTERTEQQHEMWWQIENAMEALAEAGIAEGRRQATEAARQLTQRWWWPDLADARQDFERLVGPWEPAEQAASCPGCAAAERGADRIDQPHRRDCKRYDAFYDASDSDLAAMVQSAEQDGDGRD